MANSKKIKIAFDKLVGDYYDLSVKMMVLDWMLKTGQGYDHRPCRWYVDGINKSLLGYSANNHNAAATFPLVDVSSCHRFFDSIFARAIFMAPNVPLMKWREKERIKQGEYRMLEYVHPQKNIVYSIHDIMQLKGSFLQKEHHHPEFISRKEPKIIDIRLFTIGKGWTVEYFFGFSYDNYEGGWSKCFYQNEKEGIGQFLERVFIKIKAVTLQPSQNIIQNDSIKI